MAPKSDPIRSVYIPRIDESGISQHVSVQVIFYQPGSYICPSAAPQTVEHAGMRIRSFRSSFDLFK